MKTKNLVTAVVNSFIGSSVLTASILAFSASAGAATLGCSAAIADNVTGSSACEYSNTATQDSVSPNSPLTVNSEAFFDNTDWVFGGKIGTDTGYSGTRQGQSGTWNITDAVQSTWDDVMIVFKGGNNTKLVGYLLTDGVTSGRWTSPYESSFVGGRNTKDVSHISVYYRIRAVQPPTQDIPEPGAMVGLTVVAVGAVASSRRKFLPHS